MKKILIVCYNNLIADPRVQRQIEALKDNYQIETLATGDCGIDSIPNFQIYVEPKKNYIRKIKRFIQLLTRQFDAYYWDQYKQEICTKFKSQNYDLIISNDINTLPLALGIADKKSKVLFDSHDFHPSEFDDSTIWRLKDKRYINYLCKKYINKADFFMSSSESIAAEYELFTGIKPVVINNAREYFEIEATQVGDPIKLIHHGAAIKGRKLENMIYLMKLLGEGYTLTFMLTNNSNPYYSFLESEALKTNNVFFKPPVSFNDIVQELNKFDIGVYHLEESNTNNSILLPNKIFEFIQARLCCVVTPTKELKNIVSANSIGAVASDFSIPTMADVIRNLTKDQIQEYKSNCNDVAFELSSKNNLIKINKIVEKLLA